MRILNKEQEESMYRLIEHCLELNNKNNKLQHRIDKAINRISLIRMDRDTSIETHKALDEILNILREGE